MPSENVFSFYNIPDYVCIIMIHVEYVHRPVGEFLTRLWQH